MTGREQERRRRRADTPPGSPSRRTDRVRRRAAGDPVTPHQPIEPDELAGEPRPLSGAHPSRPRSGGRSVRRGLASRLLGRLTNRRAALLALVVCALALSVAVPLNTYLSQRDDLRAQQQQQQVLRAQQDQLQRQQAELSDPAQVQAEARSRLHYVMPGETPYTVQLPGQLPPTGAHQPGRAPAAASGSWYEQLWNSIVEPNQ